MGLEVPATGFTANFNNTITSAKDDLLQITGGNGAAKPPFVVTKLTITSPQTTPTAVRVQIAVCTNAHKATSMGSALTAIPLSETTSGAPTSSVTVNPWASGQTDATIDNIFFDEYVDVRAGAGAFYLPLPGSRVLVPDDHVLVCLFPSPLASQQMSCEVEWFELF